MRRRLIRIIIILVGFVAAFGILEVAVRVVPLYPDTFATGDATLGWRYRPNAEGTWFNAGCPREFTNYVVMNSIGAHDVEHPISKPTGTQRVLVLGDSIVASLEVPRQTSFVHQVAERLDSLSDTPTEVMSVGIAGYGTAQEWLYFTTEGQAYQPDVVLLVFTPHNDFTDNHPAFMARSVDWYYSRPYFHLDDTGALVEDPPHDVAMPPIHRFLLERSALYRLLTVRARQYQPPVELIGEDYERARAESWATTFALLEAMRDSVEATGAHFGVVIEQGFLQPDERTAVHVEISRGLAERRIAYITLLDPFNRAEETGIAVRYACDSHWTPIGHNIAAEAIAPFAESLLRQ